MGEQHSLKEQENKSGPLKELTTCMQNSQIPLVCHLDSTVFEQQHRSCVSLLCSPALNWGIQNYFFQDEEFFWLILVRAAKNNLTSFSKQGVCQRTDFVTKVNVWSSTRAAYLYLSLNLRVFVQFFKVTLFVRP